MNTLTINAMINEAIAKLALASTKVGTNDKDAMGDIAIAKVAVTKAVTALNNRLFPEGTPGYVKVDELGIPVEEHAETSEKTSSCPSDANATAAASTAPDAQEKPSKNGLDEEIDFLKANLPGFSVEKLGEAYSKDGIVGGVKYLIDLTGSALDGEIEFTNGTTGKKLMFKVKGGIVAQNSDLVCEHLVKLLGFVGYEVPSYEANTFGNATLFVLSLKRKPSDINCYRIAPLVMLAHAFGLI